MSAPLVVVVTGGRAFGDRVTVWAALDTLQPQRVVEGGATGADALARDWCRAHHVDNVTVPADWHTHGRAAGPRRNALMLETYRPALVLAFPGGRGTQDCIRQALARGIPVRQIPAAVAQSDRAPAF